jgi:hypothetical protein
VWRRVSNRESCGLKVRESSLFRFLPKLEFGAVVLFRGFTACANHGGSECGLRRPFTSNEVLLALLLLRCCDDAEAQFGGRNILGSDAERSRHKATVY